MQQQAGGVIVLGRGPPPDETATPRVARDASRCRRRVMLGVPEVAAVVGGAIVGRVIEVDIDDVRRELVHRRPPAASPVCMKREAMPAIASY